MQIDVNYEKLKKITAKSQEALDTIPDKFQGQVFIAFGTIIHPAILNKRFEHSVIVQKRYVVETRANSSIMAYDKSSVIAYDKSTVVAWNRSKVEAWNNSKVIALDKSYIEAHDDSSVEAYDTSSVIALDRSMIKSHDQSSVKSGDQSVVYVDKEIDVDVRRHSSLQQEG